MGQLAEMTMTLDALTQREIHEMNHNWQAGHEPDDIEALRAQVAEDEANLLHASGVIIELREQLAAAQADELTHKALDERDHYLRELQAAQAQEAKLREALQYYEDQYCEGWCGRGGDGYTDCGGCVAKKALAHPTDDSALMDRLAQERERYADALNGYGDTILELCALLEKAEDVLADTQKVMNMWPSSSLDIAVTETLAAIKQWKGSDMRPACRHCGEIEGAGKGMMAYAKKLEAMTNDRNEWRQQHENLLSVRQSDLAAIADQLRQAKVEVLMKAVALVDLRAERTIRRLIDEIERSKT